MMSMLAILLALLLPLQELPSHLYAWDALEVDRRADRDGRAILEGSTMNLPYLEMHATTLRPSKAPHDGHTHPEEEMVIVREGRLRVTLGEDVRVLGPGGVAVAAPGVWHGWVNASDAEDVTYYIVKYRGGEPRGDRASLFVEGPERAGAVHRTPLLDRLEVHRLDAVDAESHGEEEVIVFLSPARIRIGDRWLDAQPGDLAFLASDDPHAIEAVSGAPRGLVVRWRAAGR